MWELSAANSKLQVFGSGRRALPLRSFRSSRGKWLKFKVAAPSQKGWRDAKAMALIWDHRPQKVLRQLGANHSRQGFVDLKVAYTNFQMTVATGLGPYFLKCVLDMCMPLSNLPEWIVGAEWPVNCPGYKSAMQALAPSLTMADASRLLLYVRRSRALILLLRLNNCVLSSDAASCLCLLARLLECYIRHRQSPQPEVARVPCTALLVASSARRNSEGPRDGQQACELEIWPIM